MDFIFDEQSFIERYHTDYNCDEIAYIDDIAKLLNGETEEGDAASTGEFADWSDQALEEELARLKRGVLKEAFQRYLDLKYPIED
jgi:hypothetical protein